MIDKPNRFVKVFAAFTYFYLVKPKGSMVNGLISHEIEIWGYSQQVLSDSLIVSRW